MAEIAQDSGKREGKPAATPLIELISSGIGLVVTLAILGFLAYKAVVGNDSPPQITIRIDHIFNVPGGHLVEIEVLNQGHSTASQVKVEGELMRGVEKVETSEATFDFVPARSEREGGLFFTQDPRQYQLRIRPSGYVKP